MKERDMNETESDRYYMRRALQLAEYGAGFVSPNPMVGAVIVAPAGNIIGQGWHRRYGAPHAEVNAVNSMREEDKVLVPQSTMYVTLEPCSHYGKTPPCAEMLIRKKFKRVVIGSADPFPLVAGKGIKMLRDADIEVTTDCLREECDFLNRRFITAHTLKRPYITLKWAQSADGFMAAGKHDSGFRPLAISSHVTSVLMHSVRARADAILVGTNTVVIDNPSLTLRYWPGNNPRPVTFKSPRFPTEASIAKRELIFLNPEKPLDEELNKLYEEYNITSILVEGGASTLKSFMDECLFDEIRVEIAAFHLYQGLQAPGIPASCTLISNTVIDDRTILNLTRNFVKLS